MNSPGLDPLSSLQLEIGHALMFGLEKCKQFYLHIYVTELLSSVPDVSCMKTSPVKLAVLELAPSFLSGRTGSSRSKNR